jgi:hypothetical protein
MMKQQHTLRLVRVAASVAASSVMCATQACYTYVRTETPTPPVGERVALEITDRGRVSLADRFGPGIAEIEGRVLDDQTNDYVINVYRVSQVNGQSAMWSGEETHVSRDFVGSVRTRQLSKVKTGLLIGGIGAGLALLAAKGLSGTYTGTPDPQPNPGPVSVRIPARFVLRIPLHP